MRETVWENMQSVCPGYFRKRVANKITNAKLETSVGDNLI